MATSEKFSKVMSIVLFIAIAVIVLGGIVFDIARAGLPRMYPYLAKVGVFGAVFLIFQINKSRIMMTNSSDG